MQKMTNTTNMKIKWGNNNLAFRRILGQGSFGVVFEAQNQSTKQLFAVKQLFPSHNSVSGILKEFQNCQNLKHSSIVKNYDMVQDPGCYYIIMEMCDSDLNKRLLQRKLTNDEIYNIMVETASALRYMQALNVAHRDLKPQNILLKDGKVRISDFGVSKNDSETLKTNVGTPCYQAPEVSNATGAYTGKCDVFSLGIILYEMCYGKKPFRTTGWGALLQDINKLRTKPIQIPAEPVIHQLFKRLIQGCMVYNPDERMSIIDVYYELRNFDWIPSVEIVNCKPPIKVKPKVMQA